MRNKGAQRVLIVLVVGASLVLFGRSILQSATGTFGAVVNPVARVFRVSGSSSGNFFRFLGQVSQLNDRNTKLERQVAALKLQLSQDNELRVQNEALRKQLNFGSIAAAQLLPAEVIAYQPDNFREY